MSRHALSLTGLFQRARSSASTQVKALATGVALMTLFGAPALEAADLDPLEVMRTKGCTACHIIPGIPEAKGTMGPTLKGMGTRKRIVGGMFGNTDKNMRRWLKYPKKLKSGTMMPNVGLSDDEVESLVQYFKTL